MPGNRLPIDGEEPPMMFRSEVLMLGLGRQEVHCLSSNGQRTLVKRLTIIRDAGNSPQLRSPLTDVTTSPPMPVRGGQCHSLYHSTLFRVTSLAAVDSARTVRRGGNTQDVT